MLALDVRVPPSCLGAAATTATSADDGPAADASIAGGRHSVRPSENEAENEFRLGILMKSLENALCPPV